MKDHLSQWWAAHLAWISGVAVAVWPSLREYICSHPVISGSGIGGVLLLAILKQSPLAKAAVAVLFILLFGSPVQAQNTQHFSASGNVVSFMGPAGSVPASVADGYFNATKHISFGYQQITIPSLATIKLGMISGDCTLAGCLGKKITSHLVFDATKPRLQFFGGVGKLNQSALNVNRIAEGIGMCLAYPVSGNVSLNLACGEWIHGGIVNGFITTGIPGQAPTPAAPQSSTASVFSGVKVHF